MPPPTAKDDWLSQFSAELQSLRPDIGMKFAGLIANIQWREQKGVDPLVAAARWVASSAKPVVREDGDICGIHGVGGIGGPISLYAYEPSSNWAQGGPIIERERIDLSSPEWPGRVDSQWQAESRPNADGWQFTREGPTPLIAAMRAFLSAKFGEKIELP